jgi:hypothetical protein
MQLSVAIPVALDDAVALLFPWAESEVVVEIDADVDPAITSARQARQARKDLCAAVTIWYRLTLASSDPAAPPYPAAREIANAAPLAAFALRWLPHEALASRLAGWCVESTGTQDPTDIALVLARVLTSPAASTRRAALLALTERSAAIATHPIVLVALSLYSLGDVDPGCAAIAADFFTSSALPALAKCPAEPGLALWQKVSGALHPHTAHARLGALFCEALGTAVDQYPSLRAIVTLRALLHADTSVRRWGAARGASLVLPQTFPGGPGGASTEDTVPFLLAGAIPRVATVRARDGAVSDALRGWRDMLPRDAVKLAHVVADGAVTAGLRAAALDQVCSVTVTTLLSARDTIL